MSKCDLQIVVDRPQPYYKMGEEVTGAVLVRVNAPCECKKLTLTVNWQTHGKGNRARSHNAPWVLFSGRWEAGQEYRYPFKFNAPYGPITYHGHIVNLDWFIQARADIPWAIDPKQQHEILLLPAATRQYNAGRFFKQPRDPAQYGSNRLGCLLYIGIGTIVFTLIPGLAVGGPAWIFSGVGGFIGLLFVLAGVWRRIVQSKVGKPKVTIDSVHTAPGKNVDVAVTVEPRKPITLDKVTISMHGREQAVRGSGTNKTTYHHDLYGMQSEMDVGDGAVAPGQARTFKVSFPLPPESPPSLSVASNKVEWWVDVHVGVANWPDWNQKYTLGVLPLVTQPPTPITQ
jgi:hypothetical protein